MGIGEYISSLSNAAALEGQEFGYLVWGVNNDTHEITGTKFEYRVDVKNELSEKPLLMLLCIISGFLEMHR